MRPCAARTDVKESADDARTMYECVHSQAAHIKALSSVHDSLLKMK